LILSLNGVKYSELRYKTLQTAAVGYLGKSAQWISFKSRLNEFIEFQVVTRIRGVFEVLGYMGLIQLHINYTHTSSYLYSSTQCWIIRRDGVDRRDVS